MIDVKELSVSYQGASALRRISMTVIGGEAVAVIGPNGAGKSTLLKAISGLVPYSGDIIHESQSLKGLLPNRIVRRGIIHCPEGGQLFGEMTVEQNLQLGSYTVRGPRREDQDRVFTLFPRLAERRKQHAATLSGGERQMLAIGRSLMSQPRILMLDEPSLGLAPLLRERIGETIQQIRAEWHLTIIIVEQDSSLALTVGDRVYVLDSGEIVREGMSDEIAGDPAIREVYLGVS